MPLPLDIAVNRYSRVREDLVEQAPEAWADVLTHCEQVPEQITTESFWQFGKDKPCWSNIKVAIGARIASDLLLSPDFASHHLISGPAWKIDMLLGDRSWKRQSNFQMVGAAAAQFIGGLTPGGLRSYPWRLYAIREFAQALVAGPARHMVQELIAGNLDFGVAGAYSWASRFARHAGHGWGATTVKHMLTDLGLDFKNDLHVRRSAVRIGLLAPQVASDLPIEQVDARASELDPLIDAAIHSMSRHVAPLANPAAASPLREVDKVLMEWSRKGLLHPL